MKKEDYSLFEAHPIPSLLLERLEDGFLIRRASNSYAHLLGKNQGEQLLNYDLQEILSISSKEKLGDFEALMESLDRVSRSLQAEQVMLRWDSSTRSGEAGETRSWLVDHVPVRQQNRVMILHTLQEKTREVLFEEQQLQLENDLEKNRMQRVHFVENNPDGLYSLDTAGNFLSLNEGLVEAAEVPREQLLQSNFLPFCTEWDRERVLNEFEKTLAGEGRQFEADFISGKGNEKSLRIALVPMKVRGRICGVYGISKDITALKKAEETVKQKKQEIEEAHEKFRILVESSFDVVGIIDNEGNFQFVSDSSNSILGMAPEVYQGKNPLDQLHPEDKQRVQDELKDLSLKKKVRIPSVRIKDGKGNWKWMETTVTDLRKHPAVRGLVINTRDVSEIVEKKRELEDLYERYSLAAAATGDLVYDWDLVSDTVKRFFKGKEQQFGYDAAEMDRRSFWREHVHPDELENLRKILKRSLLDPDQKEIRTEYRLKRANGSYAYIIDRGMIVRDENGRAVRMVGATSDITEILNHRDALDVANKRFSYAMKATQEMIWDWDISDGIIERSSVFKKIYGYDPDLKPSVENFWFDRVIEEDQERVRQSLRAVLENPDAKKWRQEYGFLKSDGEKAYVIDRGYILRNSSGKATRMIGATLDVTASRNMMQEIKKQNEILREIAWEQSHTVRAPLARLKGLLEFFEDPDEEWDRQEILKLLKSSADELDLIIRKIVLKTEEIDSEG